jgi:hypothetical protein
MFLRREEEVTGDTRGGGGFGREEATTEVTESTVNNDGAVGGK